MKKYLGIAAVLATAFFLRVPQANALLVGTLSSEEADGLLVTGQVVVHPTLSRMDGTSLTSLSTTIGANYGGADEYGGWLYYTSASGFWKQRIGTNTRVHIRSGSTLQLIDMAGKWAVVSDSGSRGSFIFSAQTGRIWKLNPLVKEITWGVLTSRGGDGPSNMKLAIIAKNADGKEKLFISDGGPWNLTEKPLPRYATTCANIGMSPNNSHLILNCDFSFKLSDNSVQVSKGYYLANLERTTLSSGKRVLSGKTMFDVEWINNNHLVTVERGLDGITQIIHRTVNEGRITGSEIIASDVVIDIDGREAIISPLDTEPGPGKSIYYTLISEFTDGNTPYLGSSIIGLYDLLTKSDTVIASDAFRYFPN